MKPLFSVVVPVYNVEGYLRKALDSCVHQNFSAYEIIVVNDGSPDNCQQIIEEYHKRYPSLIRPFRKENGGLSDARNFGIRRARGAYILFLDGDDCFIENCFQEVAQSIVESQSDLLIYNFETVDENGKTIARTSLTKRCDFSLRENPDLLVDSEVCAWNKAYKKELFAEVDFPVGAYYEDLGTTPRMLVRAKTISTYPLTLVRYLAVREGKISGTFNEKSFSVLAMCDTVLEDFRTLGEYDFYSPQLKYLCIREIREQLRTAAAGKGGLKFLFLRECHRYIRRRFHDKKTYRPLPDTPFGFLYNYYFLSFLYFLWKGLL